VCLTVVPLGRAPPVNVQTPGVTIDEPSSFNSLFQPEAEGESACGQGRDARLCGHVVALNGGRRAVVVLLDGVPIKPQEAYGGCASSPVPTRPVMMRPRGELIGGVPRAPAVAGLSTVVGTREERAMMRQPQRAGCRVHRRQEGRRRGRGWSRLRGQCDLAVLVRTSRPAEVTRANWQRVREAGRVQWLSEVGHAHAAARCHVHSSQNLIRSPPVPQAGDDDRAIPGREMRYGGRHKEGR
jgi:hypothetical protein